MVAADGLLFAMTIPAGKVEDVIVIPVAAGMGDQRLNAVGPKIGTCVTNVAPAVPMNAGEDGLSSVIIKNYHAGMKS